MKKKKYTIIQRITDLKKIKKLIKLSDGIIKPKTKEIFCKGPKEMSKEIWSKEQQNYLDDKFDAIDKKFDAIDKKFEAIDKKFDTINQRFKKLESRMDNLENQVKQNADGINQIIQILARNGMR